MLMSSTLNLNANTLVLTFNVMIDNTAPIDCTAVRLGAMDFANSHALSQPPTVSGMVVTCILGSDLQIAIKSNLAFGTNASNTFVYFDMGTNIMVMGGGPEVAADTTGTAVARIANDLTSPELESFIEFDLNQGFVTLSFSEAVDVSSLNFNDLTFQNDFSHVTTSESFTLTGGECDASFNCTSGDLVSFRILPDDLNAIKLLEDLCTSTTDCVPTFSSNFVSDFASLPITAYDPADLTQRNSHQLLTFVSDTTSPKLVAFDLNLSTDELTLIFDEPVSVATFNPDQITVQATSSGGDMVQLTSETIAPISDNVTLTLSLNGDANNLKLSSFATSRDDTFLFLSSNAIQDLFGSAVVAISSSIAQQVRNYTEDTFPPMVATFTLDLDSNQLIVTFSEPVFASSIISTNFTLSNGSTTTLNLGGSMLVIDDAGSMPATNALLVVRFSFDGETLTSLKTDPSIGTSTSNTYLDMEPFSYDDTSNNTAAVSQRVRASSVVDDNTAARLISFSIDMNIGQLTLVFNDVVDADSARLRRTISVQDAQMSTTDPYEIEDATTPSNDSTVIIVDISSSDLTELKTNFDIATSSSNAFVTIEASAFNDLHGEDIIATTDDHAIQAFDFAGDTKSPTLKSFNFDLDAGQLIMTFDEPVANSFNFNSFRIRESGENVSAFIALKGGTPTTNNVRTIVTLTLDSGDLNNIKANVNIATSSANTFLQLLAEAVSDTAGNPVVATFVNDSYTAVNVNTFTPDTTPPAIDSFVLDMNEGQLQITFNETINITTFQLTRLTLQSSSATDGIAITVPITGGSFPMANNAEVTLTLTPSDLNALKLMAGVGESTANTYLRPFAMIVSDMSGIVYVEQTPLVATNVIPDRSAPILNHFILDLNNDTISLTFDEPVNASSLDITQFRLQNSSVIGTSPVQIPLDGTIISPDGTNIDTQLPPNLALMIKTTSEIATSADNTFITFQTGAVEDLATPGNPIIVPVAALQASSVVPDLTGPLIDSFDFDLNSGVLTLYYQEPVDPNTFDGSFITIQDASSATTSYILSGGTLLTTTFSENISITLLDADLNTIKANTGLATSENNTYLVLAPGVLMDMFGNPVAAVVDGSALSVTDFTPDTTPPIVTTFDLRNAPNGVDLILVVFFSETVNASTVDPTSFTLLEASDSSNTYSLTGGTVTLINSAEIDIMITEYDLDAIKNRSPLASTRDTGYLSARARAVTDMVGLSSLEVTPDNAVQGQNISADLIPPALDQFSLDMNTGNLSLTFTENVVPSTLNVSNILLQGARNVTSVNQTIESSHVITTVANPVIDIQLSSVDLHALTVQTSLATNLGNTFISLTQGVVEDPAQNLALEIPADNATAAARFTPNATRPNLIAFDLDMDSVTLTLVFDEVVDVNTLDLDQIEIQNQITEPNVIQRLQDYPFIAPNGRVVNVRLHFSDQVELQRDTRIAVSNTTTFLAILNFAIRDTSGNFVVRIPNIAALPVRNYTADTSQPYLTEFRFDLDAGILYLSFNEAIQSSSVTSSRISLLAGPSPITTYEVITPNNDQSNDATVTVTLNSTDLNAIKLLDLCTDVTNCFISLENNTVLDFVSLSNIEYPLENPFQATIFYPDITRPQLTEFVEFNLRDGIFTLKFNEPVRMNAIDPTGIILQSLFEQPASTYTLTNATTDDPNGVTVTFNLSRTDLAAIRANPFICTRRHNCYVRLLSNSFQDTAGNPVQTVTENHPGFIVTQFFLDTEKPILETFTLDMNAGIITLTFNKAVSYQSLQLQQLTLQSALDGSLLAVTTYTLTGGVVPGPDGNEIVIFLTEIDFDAFKANDAIATSVNDTFIFFNETLITDVADDPLNVIAVPNTAAVQADGVVADRTPPTISEFQLDLTLDRLLLTFDEPVRTSTLTNFTLFTIHTAEMPPNQSVTLTGGQVVTQEDGVRMVTVMLLNEDVTAIKLNERLGTDVSSTFLTLEVSAIKDMAGNLMGLVTYVHATAFVPDSTRPQLISFALDMIQGVLDLTFDDAMLASSFDSTAFRFQDTIRATDNRYHTLTSSYTSSSNGYEISLQLSDEDFFSIKNVYGLARSMETSWLTMQAFAIDDLEGIDVLAITDGKAIQASNYVVDDVPPQLFSFILDLNKGLLNLTFDDFMNATTLSIDTIVIQNDTVVSHSEAMLQLSGGVVTRSEDGRTLSITLTLTDLNALKNLQYLATTSNDTFLTIPAGVVNDLFANSLSSGVLNGSALQATEVLDDITLIQLTSFDFDLTSGVLSLAFSETYLEETFSVVAITFQGARNASRRSDSYTLTGADSIIFVSSTTVNIVLTETDLNALKSRRNIASERQNTYISVDFNLVEDVSHNFAMMIFDDNALRVSTFIPDQIRPQLLNYTLDLNAGAVIFTFTEVIDGRTVTPDVLQFQDKSTSPVDTYTLKSALVDFEQSSPVTVVNFTSGELNEVKSIQGLLTSRENTFISLSSSFVADLAGNEIAVESGLQAAEFITDTTSPELLMYSLDMDTGVLMLNFSETVNVTTLNLAEFVIQSNPDILVATGSVALVTSRATGNSASYAITLGRQDINNLKLNPLVATRASDTFLIFSSGSVLDMLGNPIIGISVGITPVTFVPDTTSPILESYDLDFGLGTLNLNFSEPIDNSTVVVTAFTLQNQSSGITPDSFQLTADSQVVGPSDDMIIIRFGIQDLNAIKSIGNLATSNLTTYLSFTSTAAQDLVGNFVQEIMPTAALQARNFIPDTVGPILQHFTLDLNTGQLSLTFGETIDSSSINLDRVTFQDAMTSPGETVRLTSGIFPNTNDIEITVTLSGSDLDQVKVANLANSRDDTYLFLEAGAIADTAGNIAQPATFQATSVTPDTTGPTLVAFDFDLNMGIMTLSFDEAVNITTFQLDQLTLAEEMVDTIITIDFSPYNGSVTNPLLRDVVIQFTPDDLNEIKRIQVCSDNLTCYLYFPQIGTSDVTVRDIAGNPVSPIPFFLGRQVSTFVPDTTPPTMVQFTVFDLDSGVVTLNFDETINASSVVLSAASLADSYAVSTLNTTYSLQGGEVLSQNVAYISFSLSTTDLNAVKADIQLCTNATVCWIRFSSLLVADMAGNQVHEVVVRTNDTDFVTTERAQIFIQDTTAPELVSFDFDLNSGEFHFTFDEPINPATLQVQALTIQDAFTAVESYNIRSGRATSTLSPTTLTLAISETDLVEVKARTNMATSIANTYLTHTSQFIRDTSSVQGGNPVLPRTDGVNALQASNVTGDVTDPHITQFSQLDLNAGTFRVTFDEPVDIVFLNFSGFRLQSMTSGGSSLTLNGGTAQYNPAVSSLTEIEVELSSTDLRDLKLATDLGTQRSDSYLFVSNGAISDVSGNPIANTSGDSAEQVANYVRDTTAARLVYFSLDMNQGILHLSFDDVMLASSFDVQRVGLQNNASDGIMYSLTSGEFTMQNGYNVTVTLSSTDLNEIKALRNLASSRETTYIVMSPNAITDIAGVEIVGITETNAFQASDYISDVAPPTLRNFTFDLGQGVLVITFSEAVDPINFRPNQIILQNTSNVDAQPTVQYTIINGTIVSTSNREVYMFFPSILDLNNIKALLTLGTDESNTYIVISSAAFQDLSTNAIVAIPDTDALQASVFSDDFTSPLFTSFTFDLNSGTMLLTFSESIKISTFNYTGFTLSSSRSLMATWYTYTFTGGDTDTRSGNVINFLITLDDLNNIKALTDLATSSSNTFLLISTNTFEDTSGNPGVAIGADQAIQGSFLPDVTDPRLVSYDFNLGLGFITLYFSETVDPVTLDPNAFTIQSAPAFPVDSLLLTGVTTNSTTGPVIEVFLRVADSDAIKQTPGFATARGSTFLAFNSTAIQDVSGNPVRPFSTDNALQVNRFFMDNVQPELNSFNLDMDDGTLTLSFSESVQTNGFLDPTSITLHSGVPFSTDNYTLTGGNIQVSDPQSVVPIQLTASDLNNIKTISGLANSSADIFVSILANSTTDVEGNWLTGVEPENALAVTNFTRDSTPPTLVGFEIRLIEEPLQFILTFSEATNTGSVSVSMIQLSDGINPSSLTMNGTVTQNSFTIISINVSQATLTSIRSMPALARSRSTTVLSMSAGAIQDAVGNGIRMVSSFVATIYSADLIPPFVAKFTFDLNSGAITLTFSEDVQGGDFQPSLITLLDAPGSSNQISITDAQLSVSSSDTVHLILDDEDIATIKLDERLGVSLGTTYIAYGAGIVCDIANNCNEQVNTTAAIRATQYITDTIRPRLTRFDLNVNTQELILYFSEVVNASSLDPLQITFQNQRAPYPVRVFTLTGGSVVGGNGLNLTLILSIQDKNAMKALGNIITSASNTFISITSELVRDMAGNYVQEIRPRNALGVTDFDSDSQNPDLQNATLDLDNGILTLNFDETVNISSLQVTELTLSSTEDQYTLTDSAPVSLTLDPVNPSSLQIQLSSTDLNEIKNLSMCSGHTTGDCFLSYSSTLIQDTAGFAVNERLISNPLSVTVHPDVTGPRLVEFRSLNFIDRTLTLRFDEPVNSSTLVPSNLILQSLFTLTGRETSHRLISGFVTQTDIASITIQFSLEDLYAIQENDTLCTGRGSCYVRLEAGFISDLADNTNQVVANTFPGFIVTDFVAAVTIPTLDLIPPFVATFTFDLNSGAITLTFNEDVQGGDLQPSLITLLDAPGSSNQIRITAAQLSVSSSDTVRLILDNEDVATIKLDERLGVSLGTTYIAYGAGIVCDIANNCNEQVNTTAAIHATQYIADTIRPRLTRFDLNVNTQELILYFSEVVNASSLDPLQITFQNQRAPYPVRVFTLTGGSVVGGNGVNLTLILSIQDKNSMKALGNIITSASNTFISITSELVRDMAGNYVQEIRPRNALSVADFDSDSQNPGLQSATLDLDNGILTLNFDETVNISSLQVTELTLSSNEDQYTLTDSVPVSLTLDPVNPSSLQIQLSSTDLNEIKNQSMCSGHTTGDCFLSYSSTLVQDAAGIAVNERLISNPLRVTVHPDVTGPRLVEFRSFNFIDRTLTLRFDEPVNSSTLVPSNLILQSLFTLTARETSHRFISGFVTETDIASITIQFSLEDLYAIQENNTLCTGRGSCYVRLEAGFISDLADNTNQVVANTFPGFIVTDFVAAVTIPTLDLIPPFVATFTFDLNSGAITLTFNEDVQGGDLQPSLITLLDAPGSSNQIPITAAQLSVSSSDTVRLILDNEDVATIKLDERLGISLDTTYIAYGAGIVCDIANNSAEQVNITAAIRATRYIADIIRPRLTRFDLNVDTQELILYFSEVVNASSLDPLQITFQNQRAPYPVRVFTLTSGSVVGGNGLNLTLILSIQDKNSMKALGNIITSASNTFISITSELVRDMAGNYVQEIRPRNALGVTDFDSDSQNPDLQNATLDLDNGILTLNFDETVNISSLQVTELTLSSNEDQYTLTDSAPVSLTLDPVNPSSLQIQLSSTDLNEIKNQSMCSGHTTGDCFLSYSSTLVQDAAGIAVNERLISNPLRVTVHPDVTGPRLVEFRSFNFIDRTLTLRFDEPVNSSTLVPSNLILQSLFTLTARETSHRFISGFVTETDIASITIQFSLEDLYAIQENNTLCTGRGSCYVRLEAGFISDLADNTNQVVANTFPGFIVTDFVAAVTIPTLDLIPPFVATFTFDLNSGAITLTFNEDVQGGDLQPSLITLLDAPGSSNQIPITAAQLSVSSSDTVRLILDNEDVATIKLDERLGISLDTTYIAYGAGIVCDIANNSAEQVNITAAIRATRYIADIIRPRLTRFDLNVDTQELILYFSEVVNASSLDPLQITFQNQRAPYPVRVFTLTSGSVVGGNGLNLTLILSIQDKNSMKALGNIITSASNTFISITSELVRDMAGNYVQEIRPRNALGVTDFDSDSQNPDLQNATLDLDNGILTLNFDETVNISSLQVTELTLSSNEDQYTLTDSAPVSLTLDPVNPSSLQIQLHVFH